MRISDIRRIAVVAVLLLDAGMGLFIMAGLFNVRGGLKTVRGNTRLTLSN